ncbi:hypothetical protein DQ04_17721000 [Trypanosoma grayi]|uniref:hypothetical protein n=1 Tax=Trypanosoma grayi TaxID=71804 RepID=UPI0004F41328|nr:hypothetical protein DQ04_17721000 [Trypanosoma grayi]KEG05866.1 hypothetical protein DQ04_17721000 [Trypanosoma grayi]
MNSGRSPMIRLPTDVDQVEDYDSSALAPSPVLVVEEDSPLPLHVPARSPIPMVPAAAAATDTAEDRERRPVRDDASVGEGDSSIRSAAPPMAWNGASNISIRLDGSMMDQTIMMGTSALRQVNSMSPSIALPTPTTPLLINSSNRSGGCRGREARPDRPPESPVAGAATAAAAVTRPIGDNANPWRRVQVVSLPTTNVVGGSPAPVTPVDTLPLSTQRQRAASPSRRQQFAVSDDAAGRIGMSVSYNTMTGSTNCSDATPQREGSPSRQPSSAVSTTDTSRQLNISLMSGSMSFRPPVGSISFGEVPKGSPLAFDSSMQSMTLTTPTALQHPKPRLITRVTPTAATANSSSQFRTVICGKNANFGSGGGLPLSRGLVGGGSLRRTPVSGHSFVDPHDIAALARQKPHTTAVPDASVFQPWSPLGHDCDTPDAQDGNTDRSNHNGSCKDTGGEADDGGDGETRKKSMAPARQVTNDLAFSVNEDDAFSCRGTNTLMEATLMGMQLHDGSASVSVSPHAVGMPAAEASKPQQPCTEKNAEEAKPQEPEEPPARGSRQPSLRNRSPSRMNDTANPGGKQESHAAAAAAAASQPTAPSM